MTCAVEKNDLRALVFAPIGRDATLTSDVLARASLDCQICQSISELCDEFEEGAGAILLTEEALDDRDVPRLSRTLAQQPTWSDIAILLFAGDGQSQASLLTLSMLEVLRNVTLLDRPMRVSAVISMVQSALRGRRRQYELRDVLMSLRSARHDAEEASQLKDEFLATLSHELRTPLNAILGWVSMLRHSQVDKERVPEVLEIIERNAKAQAQLVGDVVDVSRMIMGRVRLELVPVDLSQVVRDAVDSVSPAAHAKGLTLESQFDGHLPRVQGDANRLRQVCWNLLANAIKFTPRGGTVKVRVARSADWVEISVADSGVGLSPEFLPFVFDRFRQADQSLTRTFGGLGLGLGIVKHLVEMHGGQVAAESAGIGRGATFYVRLPIRPSDQPRAGQRRAPATLPGVR